MTSRERLQIAVARQVPDRVPLDLGGSITGITLAFAQKLCHAMGIEEEPRVIVKPLQLVELPEEVLVRLHIDTRYVRPFFPGQDGKEVEYVDEWGVRRKLSSNGFYYDIVEHPLREGTLREIERFPWPEPGNGGVFKGVREKAEALYRYTDYAVIGDPLVPALFEPAWYLRGMDNFLVDLVQNRVYAERLLDALLEFQLQFFGQFLSYVGEFIQVIMLGDDLGTQRAPLLSPKLYREVIKPRHKELFAFIKEHTDAKIFLHSCGAIGPLIPDFIDAGVEILHPLQPLAQGMEHAQIKARYGNWLCFWGGIDIQKALPGSKADTIAEAKRCIESLGCGGGYVLSPAHNIQPDVPPENLLTLFDYAVSAGSYEGQNG